MLQPWFIYSLFAFFGYFAVNFIFKLISNENPYLMSLLLYGCAALAMLIVVLSEKRVVINSFKNIALASLAGIFSVIATVFALKSIKIAPNPGYSVAIYSANFVLLAIISSLVFKSELSLTKFIGIISIFAGIVLLSV